MHDNGILGPQVVLTWLVQGSHFEDPALAETQKPH